MLTFTENMIYVCSGVLQ